MTARQRITNQGRWYASRRPFFDNNCKNNTKMNKEELKQYIDENVYENQDGEITGESLNAVLKAIVDDGGTKVEANPSGSATEILESISINGVKYSIKESSNVFGYYNSGDGKFYKEDSYETEIIGEEDKLYIDLATNTMLRYDATGSTYEPIGDSDVDKRVNGVVKESYYKRTSANVNEYAEYGTNYNSSWRYLDLSVRKGETVFYKAVGHYASNPIQPVSFVDSNGILKLKIEYSSQNPICEGAYTAPSDGVFTINMREDSNGWDDAYLYVIRASSERKVSGAVNNGKYKRTESENNSYANYDIVGNPNWRYLDLSVRKGETVFYKAVGHSGNVQPVSFADSNGILRMLIQAPSSITTYENTYTAPDNGVFTVNVRHDDDGWDDAYLYVIRSSSGGGASNESVVQLADFVDGMQGRDGVRVSKASMENADVIDLSEIFPHMNKFGNKLQLTAKVTTMGTLQFRFGPMPASGYIEAYGYRLLTIDDTNIKLYKVVESDTLMETVQHGLTITDYISVNLNCLADGTMKVEVNTNDNELNSTGRFSCVLDKWDYGVGHIRVISNQCILTDVQLSVANEMFRCPFWMFGASQEGLSDIRYAGQLMKMGYLNVLNNARSGRTSEYLIEDLRRALVFGCPKYLFYTFSNDGLDPNVYEQRVNTIIDIADSYGIKLIVKITAVVPNDDPQNVQAQLAKRNFILNLLSENKIYRVFDFGKAVSADPTDPNELYNDYLDSALLHPKNAKAAAAVAMQFCADVPEIMQYGKQSNDNPVGSAELAVSITYAALKALRDGGNLVPGTWYRITDYHTTVSPLITDVRSADHQFDVIVRADDASHLNENGYAAHHEGDEYFAACKLEAWTLQYRLENEKWSKVAGTFIEDDGDGYHMRKLGTVEVDGETYILWDASEYTEDYEITRAVSEDDEVGTELKGYDPETGEILDEGWSSSIASKFDVEGDGQGTILMLKDEYGNQCPYDFKSIQFKRWAVNDLMQGRDGLDGKYMGVLNNLPAGLNIEDEDDFIWAYTFSSDATGSEDQVDYSLDGTHWVYGNVLAMAPDAMNDLNNIVFYGEYNHSNRFQVNCSNNSFGNNCGRNSFGNNFQSNSFGNSCGGNSFGNFFQNNSFGNNCYYNTFGNSCQNNSFGNSCGGNSFGNNCNWNSFGNDCAYNSFGNYCYNNSFGNDCNNNSFGNGCVRNSFGNYCQTITVFDGVQNCSVTGGSQSAPVKNAQILNGTAGASAQNKLTITFAANKAYTQVAAKTTAGNLQIFNPADLVS